LQNTPVSIAVIIVSVLASVSLVYLLARFWPPGTRRSTHNDIVGPSVQVLGTTYAVILAFMLSGVWTNFRLAESNAEREANSLVNLSRISRGLPASESTQIYHLVKSYAAVIVNDEWPAMDKGEVSPKSHEIVQQIWRVLSEVQPQTPAQQLSLDHALAEMSNFTEFRRIRQLQSRSQIPAMLWAVLVVGAVITVASACLFSAEDIGIHMLHVFFLAFLLSLVLVAIANIDHPFRGPVHVTSQSFTYALDTINGEDLL